MQTKKLGVLQLNVKFRITPLIQAGLVLLMGLSISYGDNDYCNFVKITPDQQWCADILKNNHLTYSVCPGVYCDGMVVNPFYHQFCSTQGVSAGFPIQAIACCNPVSKEYLQGFTTEDALMDACENAMAKDKNWHPTACYCCCPGRDLALNMLESTDVGPFEGDKELLENAKNNGVSFISNNQAGAILTYIKTNPGIQQPASQPARKFLAGQEILPTLKGKFPDYIIKYVWDEDAPNAYSVNKDDEKLIVVSGGLLRMNCLAQEGIELILGNAIGRFQPAKVLDEKGYACLANADYYAFVSFARSYYFGDEFFDKVPKGYDQITQFLKLIKETKMTDGDNSCLNPSFDCRISSMHKGQIGGALPVCAGGIKPTLLQLEKQGVRVINTTQIDITFNLDLLPGSYNDLKSYMLSPSGTVIQATLDAKGFILHLQTDPLAPGNYTLSVANLLSTRNTGLDPQASSVNFTIEKAEFNFQEDL